MKHIISRPENELISRVYHAQKRRPQKDDWILTVTENLDDFDINFNEETLKNMSKLEFKSFLKKKTKKAALNYLKLKQQGHSIVRYIVYKDLNIQKYFKNKEVTTADKQFVI